MAQRLPDPPAAAGRHPQQVPHAARSAGMQSMRRHTRALLLLSVANAASAALGPPAELRLVDRGRFPLARCLDGSAPPFYHRPAISAAAANKWLIYHMGGDFCGYGEEWDDWLEDCRKRSLTDLGSASWYLANQQTLQLETSGVDVFDADGGRSPLMHDWNWVYVVYCDGHYYAGANTTRTFVSVPPPPPPPPSPPCTSDEDTTTAGGDAPEGSACLFPFTYGGDTYNACTAVDSNEDWCFIAGGVAWGNCVCDAPPPPAAAAARAPASQAPRPPAPPPPPPPVEIFFRGRYNIEGIIGTLTDSDNLGSAADIVVGGCSSGGVAVFSNADHMWSVLPRTARVASVANSGFYLNINTESWTRPPMLMANMTGALSTACVESERWRDTPWFCIVPEVAAPFIATMPVFAWQSQYDSNQLGWSCPDCGSAQDNNSAVAEYGDRITAALTGWLDGVSLTSPTSGAEFGAFVDSCHRHCGCSTGITADGSALNPKQAFAEWYTSLWATAAAGAALSVGNHTKRLWMQSANYPCGHCCSSGFECESSSYYGLPMPPASSSTPPAAAAAFSSWTLVMVLSGLTAVGAAAALGKRKLLFTKQSSSAGRRNGETLTVPEHLGKESIYR